MSEPDFTSIVIDRLARIETGITSMDKKLDALTAKSDDHADRLSVAEAKILVIESRNGTGMKVLGAVASVLAGTAIILTLLDRLYQ